MKMRKRAVAALILTAALAVAPMSGGMSITAKAAENTALADELAASSVSEDDAGGGVASIAENDEAGVSSASEDGEAEASSASEENEAGVSSISEDGDAVESRAAEATGKTQLAAPTGVEWGEKGIMMWNAVEEAEGYYRIEVYKDGEPYKTYEWSDLKPDGEGRISLSSASEISESGNYLFHVKSRASFDPENYVDSEWSDWSSEYNYVRPDSALGSVTCHWSDTAPGTICWQPVEGAGGYEVSIYQYWNSGDTRRGTSTRYSSDWTSVDISNRIEGYGAGRYRCTVRALSSDIEAIANGEEGGFSEYYDTTAAANTISGIISDAMENATAGEALATIKSAIDKTALRTAMQTDDTVLNQVKALESTYAEEQGITVNASAVSEEASAYVKADEISVVGAGLNAATGQEVRLVVSVPAEKEYVPSQHYANSVQLDIQLKRGEESVHELDIPVTITLSVPAGVNVSRLVILHYSEDGSFETVNFRTSGDGMITFTVSRFSTFAFAEQTAESEEAEDDTDDSNNDAGYFVVNVDWDDTGSRVDAAVKAANGQNVDALAGSRFTVPESVVSKLTGKKVTLALQTGNGLAFSITGTNVKTAKSLKMTLSFAESIPEAVRQQLTDGADFYRMFEMEEKENYLFRINVHLSVGKENAGKQAYLYYYDESSKTMRLAGRFTVTEDGQAMFGISRGDEYIVVVGKTSGNAGNYVVVKGDTLSGIAAKNGNGLQKLLSLNPQIKDMNKIYPDEVINIR